MDPDPLESQDDSERTYQAFESSEIAPPRKRDKDRGRSLETPADTDERSLETYAEVEERSLETPAQTEGRSLETPAQTEKRPRTGSGSGSGPRTPSGPRTRRSSSGYGSGSGSSFIADWDDEEAIPVDEEGNLFGKYRVISKLGGGGMGTVWLVEHIGLKQQRTLKVIKSEVADSETNRLRFQQEAIILAKLSRHPNAVVVYDTGFVGKFAYIDMDFQEGQTLRQRLEQTGPMPAHDVLWILGEICAVLGEAHRQKIVHRDIKPQNVMIVPDAAAARGERVKVLDFGIAKVVREAAGETYASLTQDNMGVLGTIPYSSPEQLGLLETGQTQAVVDHRSDIYSLGVMLYEMLAGARPFTGTQTKILYDHAHSPPPPFAELAPKVAIPSAVEEVVRRCLEKDPARRPQSARQLLESFSAAVGIEPPLETILPPVSRPRLEEERPVRVPTPSVWERLNSILIHRKRAILGGLVAAAIVGIAVPAAVVLYDRSHRRIDTTGGTNRRPVPKEGTLLVPQPIRDGLQARGFEPDPEGGLGQDGWPGLIRETSGEPPRRLALHGNYYLPADCVPDPPAQPDDKGLPAVLKNTRTGSRFILLEGGRFFMGNFNEHRPKEKAILFDPDEGRGHWVTVSRFYMQETEVSIGDFERFCSDKTLRLTDRDVELFFNARKSIAELLHLDEGKVQDYPATGVTRRMALEYARWIGGDLPTEAQWEFAARSAGKEQRYGWGDDDQQPRPVAEMANVANPDVGPRVVNHAGNPDRTEQGIYHMAGNVREWCRDAWGVYRDAEQKDPWKEPDKGDLHPYYVIRGGSFLTPTNTARATWRSEQGIENSAYIMKDDGQQMDLGFRVGLEILECKDLRAPSETTAWREARR